MRFAVESWAPEYGAPTQEAALDATEEPVDAGVEVADASWAPRRAPSGLATPERVRFVDGVRRVDARVWVTDDSGATRQGICATYAAGVVCCDGTARVQVTEVRRALICAGHGVSDIESRHGRYRAHPVAQDDPDLLTLELQGCMAELERLVSEQAADPSEPSGSALLVLDGPLRQRHHLPQAVGFVKTHQRSYLPDHLAPVVSELDDGQRTPVFLIGGGYGRWSWYLRLPGERLHGWAGVVRCEAGRHHSLAEAVTLADRTATLLPRFASAAHKDPRAPQNLYPIAGLERELRRRLGDPLLLYRALRAAAADTAATDAA